MPTQASLIFVPYVHQEPSRENLKIREDGVGGVFVDSLSEHVVQNTAQLMELIQNGSRLRTTSATKMNKVLLFLLCGNPLPTCCYNIFRKVAAVMLYSL